MNRRRLLTTALCSLALMAPAAAVADGGPPVVQDGPYHGYEQQPGLAKCFWSVKKKQKLSAVTRSGLTVTGQCDRDTEVSAYMMFESNTRPDNDWADRHSGGIPPITSPDRRAVKGGQPFVIHPRLKAAKFATRYAKIPLHVMFARRGTKRPNSFPALDPGQHIVLVNDVKKATR